MNVLDKIEKNYIENFKKKNFQDSKKIIEEIHEQGKEKKESLSDTSSKEENIPKIKISDFSERDKIFNIGDSVKVYYKIMEGKRERIQIFEGYVISVKGKGINKTFKVRKTSYGVGVERTFPLFSPNIVKIELVKKGKIRRAKLYYLRNRSGKKAIIKEKINFKK